MSNNPIPPHTPIEPVLAGNLLLLGEILAEHRGCKLSTISRAAHNDPNAFGKLKLGDSSISARKYDEVMTWFVANWPADLAWPGSDGGTSKPAVSRAAAASRRAIRKVKKITGRPAG